MVPRMLEHLIRARTLTLQVNLLCKQNRAFISEKKFNDKPIKLTANMILKRPFSTKIRNIFVVL